MIAALMLYSLVTGAAIGGAAWWIERGAAISRRSRRWIWVAAMFALVTLTAAAAHRTVTQSGVIVESIIVEPAPATSAVPAFTPGAVATTMATVRKRWDEAVGQLVSVDVVLMGTWLALSAVAAALYMLGVGAQRHRRRHWRAIRVDDERVWLPADEGPAVVGLLRPRVLVPEWVVAADRDTRRLILVHERQHIQAGDPWLLHAAASFVVLVPWHPIAWWMAMRLRTAIEIDCDARVLATVGGHGSTRRQYGDLLLAVAARQQPRIAVFAPALIESASTLVRRIHAMFPTHRPLARTRAVCAAAAGVLLMLLAIGVPAARLQARVMPPPAPVVQSPAAPVPAPQTPASPASSPQPRIPVPQVPAPAVPAPETPKKDEEFGKGAYPYDTPGLVRPEPQVKPSPIYTPDAMQHRIQGRVIVEVVVGADGAVEDARIAESLDSIYGMDESALAAIKRWSFAPATLNDMPVRARIFVGFDLRLH